MGMHVATSITGPHHNYLAITFNDDKSEAPPEIIEIAPVGGCEHRPLDPAKVLEETLGGISEGNLKFGTDYVVKCVRFVKNDTGPEERYRYMAYCIVKEAKKHLEQERENFNDLMRDTEKRSET